LSYVDALFDRDRDVIHVAERVNGKREYKEYPAEYIFYYEDYKGKHTSIYGKSLTRVRTTSGKSFNKEKKMHQGKRLYESDVNPVFRCLASNYLNAETPKLHKCFFDIEVDFDKDKGFADPKDPFNPVTSIALYLDWLDELICLCLKPKGMSQEKAQEIVSRFDNTILCDSEAQLLETFIQLIQDADILTGWNSEGFDIPYMVNRTARVLSRSLTREYCLWGQYPKKREYERYGKENETFDLVGRVHLDMLELYRKYTYHEMHSYSLDAISEYELGEKKIPYEGTLDQLYNNDFEKFIEYNRQDTMLLKRLDDKLQFIDLANVLAHANTVLIQTTMGAVAVTDQAIINEAHQRGFIVPDRRFDKDTTTAAGAYVAFPKKGMHEWIGSMDLNSLYPSIIRSCNMSPETIVGQVRHTLTRDMLEENNMQIAKAWEGKFATKEYELVNSKDKEQILFVDFENGETIEASGAEIYDMIYHGDNPWIITANGTILRHDIKGVVPGLLERWYAERKELQANARKAKEENNKDQFEFWDKRQLVKKINLNSLYGAILNPGSRFFDSRIGQSTTLTGRCIAKHMGAEVNRILTGDYDHVGDTIIYGDTDSVYFSAFPVFKKEIDSGKLEWNKDKVIELYDTICEEANTTFPGFMSKAFNVPANLGSIIAAGREVVAESGLFITKKRYAILVYDNEGHREDEGGKPGKIKAMGLDLKRSDTPAYMQDFLSEILLMVLTKHGEQAVIDRIKEFREEFRQKPAWEKGTPKRVNNLTNHTKVFKKTGKCSIGHAMAAINWNRSRDMYSDQYSMEIADGMKTIVCKLKKNPMNMTSIAYPIDELRIPEWFKELPFDVELMEDTIISNKVDNLLGVLNWDLSKAKASNTFDDLFSFND